MKQWIRDYVYLLSAKSEDVLIYLWALNKIQESKSHILRYAPVYSIQSSNKSDLFIVYLSIF